MHMNSLAPMRIAKRANNSTRRYTLLLNHILPTASARQIFLGVYKTINFVSAGQYSFETLLSSHERNKWL